MFAMRLYKYKYYFILQTQILFNFQDIYSCITIFDQCDYKQNCLLIMVDLEHI